MRIVALMIASFLSLGVAAAEPPRSPDYAAVQARLQRGWNSWDTNTVTGQVLLPYGLQIRLGLKKDSAENTNAFLPTALIGRKAAGEETVFPGPHAYDGSYTELRVKWRGIEVRLETAHVGDDLVMLVTPLSASARSPDTLGNAATRANTTFRSDAEATSQPPVAILSAAMIWNRPGNVAREGANIVARLPGAVVTIHAAGPEIDEVQVPVTGPYFAFRLDRPAAVSTGKPRNLGEITTLVATARAAFAARTSAAGASAEVRGAIETVLGWDTIYDPAGGRVMSPVSRIWNQNWGGYVLFDWDTFFAATMASLGNRDLAYANALEVLNEVSPAGFVPNFARGGGWKSWDRSEPPVGAITILGLYRRFHDRWLLEDSYDRLLKWNSWWPDNRGAGEYLTWGSDATRPPINPDDPSAGTLQGARYESGLDNSPMYDGVGFDGRQMQLADVGLMSLYIADCDALATIAGELGRTRDAVDLRARSDRYRRSLATLWDPVDHIYRNKDLRTGRLSEHLSPTNFYPLLANVPSPRAADQMIRGHLLNPAEFWGDRVIPSIARSNPAFKDQDYWRGRIWGPMNYLVWKGLGNYHTDLALAARRQLADRSLALFMGEWRSKGHVHENYSAVSADSDTVATTDWFYHWGALLGFIGSGVEQGNPIAPKQPSHR
ncbi:MGH1-like glycoside hydrolase domain-containing protein [Sphingomonas sp. BAUL-RG-20F-R05-02]|uniref:MGH1-like glycoside hydrolase domain-containing protein n=1 Tax=Sphingomonas sp. BAUL-RG-20F-R05-02 TaxID=2914830 RepID=UPI001F55E494|nr:trehalase family glycosidase [Sphingomonas sp. BAUL-RG-20F-R05-02]